MKQNETSKCVIIKLPGCEMSILLYEYVYVYTRMNE